MYGILSLLKKMKGKDAMKRALEVAQKFPDERSVRVMKNPEFAESSRLASAQSLDEGYARYMNPHPGTFMNYVRHRVKNPKTFTALANHFRLNPKERKVMDDWFRETGGVGSWSKGFMDSMIQDAIGKMARKNMQLRQLSDHERYMLAVARQRKQESMRGAKIIPFPKRD